MSLGVIRVTSRHLYLTRWHRCDCQEHAPKELTGSLTLLRSGGEEGGPLLLDFGAVAFGTLDLALVVFGNGQNQREFLVTALAKVFVVRHGVLRF